MIHVLLDIDETILSVPEGINAKASAIMFKKVFGIDAHEELIDNVGKTEMGIIQEVLEKVGEKKRTPEQESSSTEVPDEAYRVWAEATTQELKSHLPRVLPGIPELLTTLFKSPHMRLELLTGNSPERAEAKLKSVQLDQFFRNPETDQLNGVFGDNVSVRDQLFDVIKQQAGSGDCFVVIDDSIIGARMAQSRSIPIIMVATGKATEDQLKQFTPHVFPDFGENRWKQVISIIETINDNAT